MSILATGLLGAPAQACAQNKPTSSPDAMLDALEDRFYEETVRQWPMLATRIGDHRYDDQLEDLSPAGYERWQKTIEDLHASAVALPAGELDASHVARLKAFLSTTENELIRVSTPTYLFDADTQNGPQVWLGESFSQCPVASDLDVANFIARLKLVPAHLESKIVSWKKGQAAGLIAPQFAVKLTIDQVGSNIALIVAGKSGFHRAIARITDSAKRAEALQAVTDFVLPAYRELQTFLVSTYAPTSRADEGIWSQPGGDEMYKKLIRFHTSLDLTADEIYDIGVKELKSNQDEMLAIARRLGHEGTLAEFFAKLRADKSLAYSSREEILRSAGSFFARAEARLPELVGTLPPARYELRAIDASQEQSAASAYAQFPSIDFSTPGIFFVNTYAPETRTKHMMGSLAAHEGLPGHLLQGAYASMTRDLAKYRKVFMVTAYTEGWAHYAERLMDEYGFYETELERFGMLSDQAWRATRLIVDTGIHSRHWTRAQALEFMVNNTGVDEGNAATEIDRYASWPGQALAYKIGQREIFKVRADAQAKLGSAFDLKRFHDVILSSGSVSLSLVRENVDSWVASQLSKSK